MFETGVLEEMGDGETGGDRIFPVAPKVGTG